MSALTGTFVLTEDEVEDDKGKGAVARYVLDEVDSTQSALFEAAYGALDAEFGGRGELERREVVEKWLRSPEPRTFHLLTARTHDGSMAAIRDCHVCVDRKANAIVVYLAHVLVMPEHRRSGLASLMRAAPLALARRIAAQSGLPSPDILLAAEMEPAIKDDPATLVRLVAYGRSGFSAIDPARFPYCQPDFRDLERMPGEAAHPHPFIGIVRWIGHDGAPSLPKRLATAYVEDLYGVFGTHCRATDLEPIRRHTLRVLEESGGDDVPLLVLPSSPTDEGRVQPLLRERVLGHHLPEVAKLG